MNGDAISTDGNEDIAVGRKAPFPAAITLLSDDVHVVRVSLDDPLPRGHELLDDAERERAERFVFERDRRRFVAAHACVRTALGRCLARPAAALRFGAGRRGKPYVIDAPLDVRFNLSDGGERAVLAIALGREVGVDIEEVRPTEVDALARRVFAPSEANALAALPPDDRHAAFFRIWTRKEAFIKALGEGLAMPLDGFEVSPVEDDPAPLLRSCTAPHAPGDWCIRSLKAAPGYAAAVAVDGSNCRIVCWDALSSGIDRLCPV